jgi:hypothetical protein
VREPWEPPWCASSTPCAASRPSPWGGRRRTGGPWPPASRGSAGSGWSGGSSRCGRSSSRFRPRCPNCVQGEQRGFLLVGAASRHGPLLSGLPGAGLPDPRQFVTALEWFGGARKQDLRDFIVIGRQGGFAVGRQGEARRVVERHGRATGGSRQPSFTTGTWTARRPQQSSSRFWPGSPCWRSPLPACATVTGSCYLTGRSAYSPVRRAHEGIRYGSLVVSPPGCEPLNEEAPNHLLVRHETVTGNREE